MIELLKPFTSARQFVTAVFSWGLPLAVAMCAYVGLVFPSAERTVVTRDGASMLRHATVRPLWFMVGLFIVLTVVISSSSRWIYQILEGIRWPSSLRERRERTHRIQWAALTAHSKLEETQTRLFYATQLLVDARQSLGSAADGGSGAAEVATATREQEDAEREVKHAEAELAAAIQKTRERPHAALHRSHPPLFVLKRTSDYPARSEWIRATRLGNRIHAFETYGVARYALDPLALWYELTATAPDGLAENVQAAGQSVDLRVAAWASAILLAVASVATELLAALLPGGRALITPVVTAVAGFIAAGLTYRAATAAVEEWKYAVSALVNLGREPLARAYGLEMPVSLQLEKLMWEALGAYVLDGSDAYAKRLDVFRARATEQGPIPPPEQAGQSGKFAG